MRNKNCDKCGGEGVIFDGDRMQECLCSVLRRLSKSMDSQIRNAKVSIEHATNPITDRAKELLYIKVSWKDAKPLIKVMMYKNPSKFIRMTSDREIRDVGVGSTSRSARGDGATEAIYNNLADLVGPPDLVIIRLNELGYKNKAAAGLLEEVLCYRADRELPTWILSDKDRPFGQGSHAWSESVDDIISTSFVKVDIPRIHVQDGENVHVEMITSQISKSAEKVKNKKLDRIDLIMEDEPKKSNEHDDSPQRSLVDLYGGGKKKTWKRNGDN